MARWHAPLLTTIEKKRNKNSISNARARRARALTRGARKEVDMTKQWGEQIKCPYCGKTFAQSRHHVKYCSEECAYMYKREIYWPTYHADYYARYRETICARSRVRYRAKVTADIMRESEQTAVIA